MRADTILPMLDPSNTANRRKNGTHRHKHSLRALFRSAALFALIAVFLIFNFVSEGPDSSTRRRLQFQDEIDPPLLIIVYIIGILYMFLALAIICDEFFVPALEVMSGSFHLNLSNDIAGATLMAAGGSAPELFTSMIGTFQRSEIGFGTIVGSAVFNVLFVIGMCSICSRELLTLTWWPLARDTSYYAVSLLTLGIFVGVITPGEITLWEAIVLFAMYFGYVTVMAFNEKLHFMIAGKHLNEEKSSDEGTMISSDDDFANVPAFRAGFLTLINDPTNWEMKARIGLVSKILGSADQVFEKIDTDGNGTIDLDEFKSAMKELEGADMSDEELSDAFKHIDLDHDQTVTRKEFIKFYHETNTKVKNIIEKKFVEFDHDSDNTLDKEEFYELLSTIEPTIDPEGRSIVEGSLFTDGKEKVSREEFSEWYLNSIFYSKRAEFAEQEAEDGTLLDSLAPPEGAGAFGYAKWLFLLPLVASTTFTVPDVRRHGNQTGKKCYFAFFMSIVWIGIYSYFMVGWAELVGDFVGIPAYIMGLTFLAAGTSVPDLLSSVIVARMGEGDMAVSSSIGSNIFDILVGLPLPWIAFSAIEGEVVTIGADGIWVSIIILLAMLVLIITSIHLSKWTLSKNLGYTMFVFYGLFLLQAVLDEYVY